MIKNENVLGMRIGILHETNKIEKGYYNEMWQACFEKFIQDDNDSSVFRFFNMIICIGGDDNVIRKTLKQFVRK